MEEQHKAIRYLTIVTAFRLTLSFLILIGVYRETGICTAVCLGLILAAIEALTFSVRLLTFNHLEQLGLLASSLAMSKKME